MLYIYLLHHLASYFTCKGPHIGKNQEMKGRKSTDRVNKSTLYRIQKHSEKGAVWVRKGPINFFKFFLSDKCKMHRQS